MTTWKDILEKERRPHDSWADAMRRKFEKVLRDIEGVKKQYESDLRRVMEDEGTYRRRISEATRRGLEKARARGVKLGGARRRKSKVKLSVLRRLKKDGFTQQEIADKLGCSQALVSRKLKRRKRRKGGK